MITLTRKMFTMILSVVVYNHQLSLGQWAGAAVVFAGISVEAFVKRRGQSLVTLRGVLRSFPSFVLGFFFFSIFYFLFYSRPFEFFLIRARVCLVTDPSLSSLIQTEIHAKRVLQEKEKAKLKSL